MKFLLKLFLVLLIICSISLIGCGSKTEPAPECKHKVISVKGEEPTAITEGFKNHFKCTLCDKVFSDIHGKNEISISEIIIKKHTLTKVERISATSSSVGVLEHYRCTDNDCGKLFKDNDGKIEINQIDTILVEFIKKDVVYDYVDIPDSISGGHEIEFAKFFEEGTTDAMCGKYQMLDGSLKEEYVYLKRFNKGDYVIEFDIIYEGVYEFGFEIFAIVLNDPERRVTNIQIDNSEYIMLDYFHPQNENGLRQFASGISAYLSEGKHQVKLNLPDIFDDEIIKTLYIHSFYFAPAAE